MDQIKDALQTIVDQAQPKTDILEGAVDISATVTFGLTSFVAKALKAFKLAVSFLVREEELKMKWQDQLRDRWGTNAPDLDTFI